jgi:hypothetical protein
MGALLERSKIRLDLIRTSRSMPSDGRGASNFLKNSFSQLSRAAFSRFGDQAVPIRTIFGVNLLPVPAAEGFNGPPPLDSG